MTEEQKIFATHIVDSSLDYTKIIWNLLVRREIPPKQLDIHMVYVCKYVYDLPRLNESEVNNLSRSRTTL